MAVFELVLLLLLGGVALTLVAPRLGVPWPALLALSGAGLAFVPGMPEVRLDPELALALFVSPVLLDAAYDTSTRDLRRNWLPVGGLVLGAVGATVIAVAAAARWADPNLPWAAAVALGAIVAPPDAAAAASVLRQVKLPQRMQVILEGESLLNDASALLIYRLALAAAAGGVTWLTSGLVVIGAFAAVVLGWVLARAYVVVIARVRDEAAATVFSFLSTFGVWLLADALGLSAVLTMVAFAVALARSAPERMGARERRSSYAVWDVATFVLNVMAFILVGLQLRGILERAQGSIPHFALVAGVVLATVVLVRFAWAGSYYAATGGWRRRDTSWQGGVMIGWCGMRGIVTLAAALALPSGFPGGDLVVFAAFCTVLGTLVLQGMTLRPLLSLLALPPDRSLDEEITLARMETARAALGALAAADRTGAGWNLLKADYESRLSAGVDQVSRPMSELSALRRVALDAERAALAALRREQRIGDTAFHRLEEELDWKTAETEGAAP